MPIECVSSNLCSDIRCAVCGQGFLVFASQQAHDRYQDVRGVVQQALRQHHVTSAHPAESFIIQSIPEPHPAFA